MPSNQRCFDRARCAAVPVLVPAPRPAAAARSSASSRSCSRTSLVAFARGNRKRLAALTLCGRRSAGASSRVSGAVGTPTPGPHRPARGRSALITNALIDYPWLMPTGLVRPARGRAFRRSVFGSAPQAGWGLAAASFVPVALLTLVPVDRELVARCAVQWDMPNPGRLELMANVVLFVAPDLLAGVASRRPLLTGLPSAGSPLPSRGCRRQSLRSVVPAAPWTGSTTPWAPCWAPASQPRSAAGSFGRAPTPWLSGRQRRPEPERTQQGWVEAGSGP